MKKIIFTAFFLAFLTITCQKNKGNTDIREPGSQKSFVLNNLKVHASIVRSWLADELFEKIELSFFSGNAKSIGNNLTLIAHVFQKSKDQPSGNPVLLEIASPSNLPVMENLVLANTSLMAGVIKKIVTDPLGYREFDYLLFEPKYLETGTAVYIAFKITAYRNGSPIESLITEDSVCNVANPSPPDPPCEP